MSIFEYNKEEEIKKYRRAEYEAAYEEALEIGREEGEERERKKSLQRELKREQELLVRILSKHAQVSEKLRKQIEEEADLEVLKEWNNLAIEVNNIEEFEAQYMKRE